MSTSKRVPAQTAELPMLARLRAEACTLLVEREGRVMFASDRRGLRPLWRAVTEHQDVVEGADVADKVIGLAAAYLLLYGRVGRVFAGIMSQDARRVLRDANVPHEAESFVKQILDESRDEPCPMEQLAREAGEVARFVDELRTRLAT